MRVCAFAVPQVTDVGVEQSCFGYMTNSGTVVISVNATADASAIEDQRDCLRAAIAKEPPSRKDLLEALDGCLDLAELKAEVSRGDCVQELGHACKSLGAQPEIKKGGLGAWVGTGQVVTLSSSRGFPFLLSARRRVRSRP